MAAVLLNTSVIGDVKTALFPALPDVKSAHISEALAFALGFKTSRSLQAAITNALSNMRIVTPDDERFVLRLSELGYRDISWQGFMYMGKQFESSELQFVYPERVLEAMGWMHMDLYYYCVKLQEAGCRLPGFLSFPSIESRMFETGLKTEKYTMMNLADYARITQVFDGTDGDVDDDEPLPPAKATDDFTGVVSFRSDAPCDSDFLFDILRQRFPESWLRNGVSSGDNTSVELTISTPLTIQDLHAAMKEIPDGHITVETLRALPLAENNLHRRYSAARPRDWASLDDEDLNEEDVRAEHEVEEKEREARRQARLARN